MADSFGFAFVGNGGAVEVEAAALRAASLCSLRYASHYCARPAQQRTLGHSLELGNAQPYVS